MSLRCGLFDSTEIVQTVDGYPQGNKAETADFFAHALAGLSGNGIPSLPADTFKVTANGSMAVSVAPGYCYINGYHAWDDESETVTIASSSSARSIYISMRLNLINGEISLINDTEFTRAESIYDLALARIDIPGNSAAITSDMVTDLRGNANYCGILQKITDTAATEIWNYLSGNIQPISLGGTGAATPEAARAGLGIGKTLWSSSTAWTSGTLVVPGSSNYSLFAIDLAGSSSRVLLMREGNTLRGIGGFMSSASRLYINTAEFKSSGDTWTYGTCGAITLQASGISVTETAMGVYGIYGII